MLNSTQATTGADGYATAVFTVSKYAGDNYRVAASMTQADLNNLTNQNVPPNDDPDVRSTGFCGKVSPQLYVWRMLHLEMDSMAAVTGNTVLGNVTAISGTTQVAQRVTLDVNLALGDGSARLDSPSPGNGRFEHGSIKIGQGAGSPGQTETANLIGNGTDFVQKAGGVSIPFKITASGLADVTGNIISLSGTTFGLNVTGGTLTSSYSGGSLNVTGIVMTPITGVNPQAGTVTVQTLANIPVELRDDDVAVMPHFADTTRMAEKYADAFIEPVVDGGGDPTFNRDTVGFKLNMEATATQDLWDALSAPTTPGACESDGNRSPNFWIAYVLTAYQSKTAGGIGGKGDNDPDSEEALGGVTDGLDRGSFLFLEETKDEERELGITLEAATVVHEIGHQFGLTDRGPGGGLMGPTFYLPGAVFIPVDLCLLRWTTESPGRSQPPPATPCQP
jgi:hypothetical protein